MTFAPDDYGGLAGALAGYGRKTNPYDARRKYDYSLLQAGTDTSPVQSPWQGAARLAQALAGGIGLAMTDREEKASQEKFAEKLAGIGSITDPKARLDAYTKLDPELGMKYGAQLAVDEAKIRAQTAGLQNGPSIGAAYGVPRGGATGGPTQLSPNATAISGIETGGQPNNGYTAIGPVANAQGHRAYGKFQVLEPNIGPWTQEVSGRAWTPQEFIADTPEARAMQNAVFEAKFGQYVTKYGSPQAASRAWFAGEGGMNNPNARDVNGMTPVRYEQKFSQNLPPESPDAPPVGAQPGLVINMTKPNMAPQPSQMPPQGGAAPPMAGGQGADGMPPPVSAQNVNGPAVVAQPAVPNVPRPQPTQAQIEKIDQMYRAGEFGNNPAEARSRARAALDAEIDRQWAVDRETAKLNFQQQQDNFKDERKRVGDLEAKAPMEIITKRIDNYETKLRPAATAAVNDINAIHSVRQVLDAGAFTGTGAEAKTFLAKLGEQIGIPSEQAQNTQVLGSVLAKRVLTGAGGSLGTGFSNADRTFMEKAQGGEISMDEGALRRILDIGERQSRQLIKQHDEEAARIMKMPGVSQLGQDQFKLPDAPTYQQFVTANPLQSSPGLPQPAPAPGQMQPNGFATHPNPNAPTNMGAAPSQFQDGMTATNPQTGQKVMFRGGQWVPVQ